MCFLEVPLNAFSQGCELELELELELERTRSFCRTQTRT